ncbi:response regulator transcription factor [Nitrospirillum sp. BR 11163]|uniref:response regulator transcription factor n=1 Tax=Nitrospirillum sp. BR 11163 TaxID=3104323 RepID=UPI002AFF8F68|nr:response regulator transcription factor [Nitrospirillum sp. BR 11163]MEA1674285.1 response regulator transcription factor [Nitrospirillum sp. BR 11163]
MRLLLVEDERDLRTLTADHLSRIGFTVNSCGSLAEADDYISTADYDALVLDRRLPDGDGVSLVRRLRGCRRKVPILMLTARSTLDDRIEGLDAGADDYLVKPFDMGELAARLRALLRRPGGVIGVVLECGNLSFDSAARSVAVAGAPLALTARELALLEVLLRKLDQVVTKAHIDSALYGFGNEATDNAVEALVSRLRRKLAAAEATAGIITMRGLGYMMSAS